MKLLRAVAVLGAVAVTTVAVVSNASATATKRHAQPGTISVLYSESYEFDAKNLTDSWWGTVKKEFEAAYPGSKLKLIPVGGTDFDEQKKAALLLRSSSTAPDVVSMETPNVGELAESNYLLPLNKYTSADKTFWPDTPKAIKDMSTINGNVYAINSGNNVSAMFYNKAMLTKAGIAMPWKPKTWNDILTAARKVKATNPGVIPLWLHAGASVGPFVGLVQTSGNLIDGSTTPMMLDPKTHKWVTDSPGLRATLNFYKTVYSQGLGPPSGDLFGSTAAIQPPDLMRKGKLAIVLGSNWYPGQWVFKFAGPVADREEGGRHRTGPDAERPGRGQGHDARGLVVGHREGEQEPRPRVGPDQDHAAAEEHDQPRELGGLRPAGHEGRGIRSVQQVRAPAGRVRDLCLVRVADPVRPGLPGVRACAR